MEISSSSSLSSNNAYSSLSSKMTAAEKKKAEEILSRYDTKNMSEDDIKSMMEQLQKSGIRPTKDLVNMLSDAGIKLPELPEKTTKNTSTIDPMSMLTGNSTESSSNDLAALLEQFQNGEISEDDLRAKLSEASAKFLYGFNSGISGCLIDMEA